MQENQFGGPQFGNENNGFVGKATAWIKQNWNKAALPLVAVIILAVGIFLYYKLQPVNNVGKSSSQQEQAAPSVSQPQPTAPEKSVAQPQENKSATKTTPQTEQKKTEVKISEKTITVTASRGDGVTHLARRALSNYLQENPGISLSKEQKVYIEDYLRHQTSKKGLFVGDQISFDKQLISDAIGQAQILTSSQLQNLEKYSARVTSL